MASGQENDRRTSSASSDAVLEAYNRFILGGSGSLSQLPPLGPRGSLLASQLSSPRLARLLSAGSSADWASAMLASASSSEGLLGTLLKDAPAHLQATGAEAWQLQWLDPAPHMPPKPHSLQVETKAADATPANPHAQQGVQQSPDQDQETALPLSFEAAWAMAGGGGGGGGCSGAARQCVPPASAAAAAAAAGACAPPAMHPLTVIPSASIITEDQCMSSESSLAAGDSVDIPGSLLPPLADTGVAPLPPPQPLLQSPGGAVQLLPQPVMMLGSAWPTQVTSAVPRPSHIPWWQPGGAVAHNSRLGGTAMPALGAPPGHPGWPGARCVETQQLCDSIATSAGGSVSGSTGQRGAAAPTWHRPPPVAAAGPTTPGASPVPLGGINATGGGTVLHPLADHHHHHHHQQQALQAIDLYHHAVLDPVTFCFKILPRSKRLRQVTPLDSSSSGLPASADGTLPQPPGTSTSCFSLPSQIAVGASAVRSVVRRRDAFGAAGDAGTALSEEDAEEGEDEHVEEDEDASASSSDYIGGHQRGRRGGAAQQRRRGRGRAAAAAAAAAAVAGSRVTKRARQRGSAGGATASTGVAAVGETRSKYRGVTRHRRSGRWEAHLWVKQLNRQCYLGGYSDEEAAAEAYDLAALKVKGPNVHTNFDKERYTDTLQEASNMTYLEVLMAIRRQSQGFSRGSSSYRGVTAHPSGRWESRIGIRGSRHVYLGLYADEKAAARAYDAAMVRLKGKQAATNFSLAEYSKELAENIHVAQAAAAGDADAKLLHAHSGPAFDTYVKSGLTALGDVTASAAAQALARAEVRLLTSAAAAVDGMGGARKHSGSAPS